MDELMASTKGKLQEGKTSTRNQCATGGNRGKDVRGHLAATPAFQWLAPLVLWGADGEETSVRPHLAGIGESTPPMISQTGWQCLHSSEFTHINCPVRWPA